MNNKFHINNVFFNKPLVLGEVEVLQIGRLYCQPNEEINEHFHGDFYELTVVNGGEGTILIDGTLIKVKGGDVLLSLNKENHAIFSSEDKPLKYDFLAFTPQSEKLKKAFSDLKANLKNNNRVFKNETIETLLKNMIAELSFGDEYSEELLTASAKQLTLLTLRAFSKNTAYGSKLNPARAQIFCYQIMNYIDSHITSINSLTEVADHFLYNYSYLSDLFKNTTGRSIKEYFSAVKLKLAKDKLDTLKLTVTEISELCNFSSVYSFSRAFKKHFGISPEQYRKNKR